MPEGIAVNRLLASFNSFIGEGEEEEEEEDIAILFKSSKGTSSSLFLLRSRLSAPAKTAGNTDKQFPANLIFRTEFCSFSGQTKSSTTQILWLEKSNSSRASSRSKARVGTSVNPVPARVSLVRVDS